MGKHWNADSLAGKIREVLAKHPEGLFAHEIVEAVDAPRGPVHVALSTQLKAKRLNADMIEVPVERRVHGGRALQYRYTNVSGAPQVAGSRFEALTGTPSKPYTPPPAPPRRHVMTAPSLSKLQHDAAVAKAAAETPAVETVADNAPVDASPVPAPITSAAALQRPERVLDLPATECTTASVAPLMHAPPDTIFVDDPAAPEAIETDELPRHNLGEVIHEAFVRELERQIGPVPEPTPPEPPAHADEAAPAATSMRCALWSDGSLCVEFAESDEMFRLTRAETRILADYLLSFRVEPLEKLTCV